MQDDQAPAHDAAQHHADHAGHAYPQPEGRQHADPLVEELRDQVGYLREQLRREQDAHAEARRIIAALTARIPEHEAPSEPPQAPSQEATEQPGRVEPQPPLEAAQEPRESPHEMHMPEAGGGPLPHDQQTPSERPWWRRVFGG
jgi:hypothetical protein